MRQVVFSVDGYPPAKNEAKSLLASGHIYSDRVRALLEAARLVVEDADAPLFGEQPVGLRISLEAPGEPPSDATNYLGGVADVLEAKGRRGVLEHLGDLAGVALYNNDRQIREVHYELRLGAGPRYRIQVWALDDQ